jgi:CubicO group peptidase (beta-lactamase class C family)
VATWDGFVRYQRGEFYRERIFGPLDLDDTGFRVPAPELHRLAPCYLEVDGALEPFDDDALWSRPRAFNDCGAGLVSTAGDYVAFAKMLLAGGAHRGRRLLPAELVGAMTTDQLTAEPRDMAGPIRDGRGWGFGLSTIDAPAGGGSGPKGYGWNGGFGTVWVTDPDEDLVAVLRTQVLASPGSSAVESDFWSATYQALDG